ncbi:TIGR02099 family protein [Bacterioplanes sanyensis]|uniref:YhdP family protein n=1 Tax=Bacterioplanes sanyensis TaxID=1249553 RepID=UPI0016721A98|nr:YhdP family protein [Bacterioplanes sanyensis]GGY58143.1 TIGR02099 family protein [Bacterioplanes sanyensis]
MMVRWLRELWLQLWITLVVALVLLALYVSAGRQLIPLLETYQPEAEQWLSEQLGQPVRMNRLQGGWRGLSPLVRVEGLHIGPSSQGIGIGRVEAQLDVSASAFYRQPVFKRIEVTGVRAHLVEQQRHVWQLAEGWQLDLNQLQRGSSSEESTSASNGRPAWLDWLELQHSIAFQDWHLTGDGLKFDEELKVQQLLWRNRGDSRVLGGDIAWGADGEVAHIRVSGRLQGPLWPWRQQQGQLFLEVEEQNWLRWIPDSLPEPMQVTAARAGMMTWLNIDQGQLQRVHSLVTIPEFNLSTAAQPLELGRGVIQLDGHKQGDDWQARLKLAFAEALPVDQVYLSTVNMEDADGLAGKGWQLQLGGVDLQQTSRFLQQHALLPELWQRYLNGLQPRGRAQETRVSLLQQGEQTQLEVRADLQAVSIEPYQGIPGLKEVDAELQLLPHQGRLRIRDDQLELWLADVYDQPWTLTEARGDFTWAIHPDYYQLQLQAFSARLAGSPLTGEVALRIPEDDSGIEANTSVLLGLQQAPVALKQQLIPSLLEDELRQWLDQALVAGTIEQAVLALNGRLGDDSRDEQRSIQLYLQAQDLQLQYLQQWPALREFDGRLLLASPNLDVWVDKTRTLGGGLQPHSGRVQLRQRDGQPWLNVAARLTGNSREALRYFTDTPLRDMVDGAFDRWRAEGPLQAGLVLNMPLGDDAGDPQVQLDVSLQDNQLHIGELDLDFKAINGRLQFDSERGLFSDQLQGQLLGGEFEAQIRSTPVGEGYDMTLAAKGGSQWPAIKQWLPLFLLDPLDGELSYDAELSIASEQRGGVKLALSSDLDGTVIDLPAPMGKTAEQTAQLAMTVQPGADTRISMDYQQWLKSVLALRDGELQRGQVYLGGSDAFLPSDPGIEIRGRVDEPISAAEWYEVWQHMQALLAEPDIEAERSDITAVPVDGAETLPIDSAETGPVRLVDLQFAAIDVWDIPSGPARLQASQEFGEWQMQLESDLVTGDVLLPADANMPIQLELDYIHLPTGADDHAENASPAEADVTADPLQDVDPAAMPAMDMQLAELYIGSRNFGRWQLSSRPLADGLQVEVDDSDLKGLRMLGKMQWRYREGEHTTELNDLSFTSNDIGKVQKSFRQQAVLNAEDSRVLGRMSWRGSPLAYNPRSLDGVLSLRMRNGHMAAEGADALKAFGVLNFNSIKRRLQLDFSDLYQSGVAFDVLKAKADINDGVLVLTEPLVMDGPGSKFWLSGSSNLNYRTLDMKLAVTFPVGGSLPLVAILAGLAPPVAASIYVTERLVSDELERFTSASYTVRGTWSEPQLTINQAFDNEVDGKTSRSLGERLRSINPFGGDE